MAGVMPRIVNAVNRTTLPLDAMFDGQPVVIPAGYKIAEDGSVVGTGPGGEPLTFPLPYFAAEMVKRQNPQMGTEDPGNPRDFECLIGIKEWDDDISHIEQSDAIERLDRELMDDEAQTAKPRETSMGRKRARDKKKKRGGRAHTDANLRNPMGIRANYEG